MSLSFLNNKTPDGFTFLSIFFISFDSNLEYVKPKYLELVDIDFIFGTFIVDILDYANTNKYKTMRALDGFDANGSGYAVLWSGNWRSTSAVSTITITGGTFAQYSSFALYGIK